MLYLDISFFLHTIVADQNQIICTLGINLGFLKSFWKKEFLPTNDADQIQMILKCLLSGIGKYRYGKSFAVSLGLNRFRVIITA